MNWASLALLSPAKPPLTKAKPPKLIQNSSKLRKRTRRPSKCVTCAGHALDIDRVRMPRGSFVLFPRCCFGRPGMTSFGEMRCQTLGYIGKLPVLAWVAGVGIWRSGPWPANAKGGSELRRTSESITTITSIASIPKYHAFPSPWWARPLSIWSYNTVMILCGQEMSRVKNWLKNLTWHIQYAASCWYRICNQSMKNNDAYIMLNQWEKRMFFDVAVFFCWSYRLKHSKHPSLTEILQYSRMMEGWTKPTKNAPPHVSPKNTQMHWNFGAHQAASWWI